MGQTRGGEAWAGPWLRPLLCAPATPRAPGVPRGGRTLPSLPGIVKARSRSGSSGLGPKWATALRSPRTGGALLVHGRGRGARVPTRPLREGPQFYPGRNGGAETTAGKRLLLGRAANPESTQTPRASGSPGPNRAPLSAVPPLRIELELRGGVGVGIIHARPGAGPLQLRPGPIGCGVRGGARLPDVGAVAAAGATESEEPRDKIEGEGAAGGPARPCRHRSRWSSQRNRQAWRGLRHRHAQHSA